MLVLSPPQRWPTALDMGELPSDSSRPGAWARVGGNVRSTGLE